MRLKEVAYLQTAYQALFKTGISKKAMCELVVPFRDRWGLTDKQALMIARNELPLSEIEKLLRDVIPSCKTKDAER